MPTKDEDQLPISSSKPPEFAPEQEQLFREVLTLLNDSGVPYVISGAFALREHTGICRDTKDLDVFLPPENVREAMEYLQKHGFECEVADPVWLAKAHRGDFFVDLIKQQAKFIGAGIGAAGGLAALTKLGPVGIWIAGIAAAVTLAVDVIVALWAPADPIIRDSFGFSATDLDRLTSASFPAPPPLTIVTEGDGGILVNVNKTVPPEKLPLQYRETREYVSRTEDSRYEIGYRYNRVA